MMVGNAIGVTAPAAGRSYGILVMPRVLLMVWIAFRADAPAACRGG